MAKCFGGFSQDWNTFFSMFLNKELAYGDWFDHVTGWWDIRNRYPDQLLIITYEELQRDAPIVISRIARFCGNGITTSKMFAEKVAKMASFDEMKEDPNANRDETKRFDKNISSYMRKGKVGGWKKLFTVAQNRLVDEMVMTRLDPVKLAVEFEI